MAIGKVGVLGLLVQKHVVGGPKPEAEHALSQSMVEVHVMVMVNTCLYLASYIQQFPTKIVFKLLDTKSMSCNLQACYNVLRSHDWVGFKSKCITFSDHYNDHYLSVKNDGSDVGFSHSLKHNEKFQIIAKDKSKKADVEDGDIVGIHWGYGKYYSCPCGGNCNLKSCPGRVLGNVTCAYHFFIILKICTLSI